MGHITGGRIRVRCDDPASTMDLIIIKEELANGALRYTCRLPDGVECERVDDDTWRIKGTGQVLRNVEPRVGWPRHAK